MSRQHRIGSGFDRRMWGMVLGVAIASILAAPGRAAAELRAGAASVKITPSLSRTVFIGGYEQNRIAESVHDDLWARALVLDDGQTRMAIVVCDLVGMSNYRVQRIRARIRSVPPEKVLIATTHVHSGPDTLGLWGKGPLSSGLDPTYMAELEEKVTTAVENAARDARPARLAVGTTDVPEGLVYNSREPIQDKQLTGLRFTDRDGKTIASMIHYGAHPEVNKSKALTSDFVHYVREAVEKRFGGVSLFLNGALGGMVTPKVSAHSFEEMQRVGEGVGKAAVQALEKAEPETETRIAVRSKRVQLPLENQGFKLLAGAKILDGDLKGDRVDTEVWRIDLGRVTWMSIPGEILPKPALALKQMLPGKYRMILALGNDELGYILDPEDFDKPLYKYERSMSLGRQTWPLLFAAARELLE